MDKDKNRELELASTASPVKLDVKDLLRKKLFAAVRLDTKRLKKVSNFSLAGKIYKTCKYFDGRHAHNFQAGHQLDHVQNHAAEASLSVFVFV